MAEAGDDATGNGLYMGRGLRYIAIHALGVYVDLLGWTIKKCHTLGANAQHEMKRIRVNWNVCTKKLELGPQSIGPGPMPPISRNWSWFGRVCNCDATRRPVFG